MTRARLKFPHGDPIEITLADVVAYGPEVRGFKPWLGAVNASKDGRWIVRVGEDQILGFTRAELKKLRLTPAGAELTFGGGDEERTVIVREDEVTSYGPEPTDVRSWLGRLAQGSGEAWLTLRDGRELRFTFGDGPHVAFLEPR